HARNIH
ncbi:hypothetical protein BVZ54_00942B, partial [Haemophilus influenzae]